MNELNYKRFEIKTGNEEIKFNGEKTGYKLKEFWQWSSSDLLSNATRGKFAEYIIATLMDVNLFYVREEWGEYDLTATVELDNGKLDLIKIEVKSSSYLQTWDQEKYSKIIYSIKKRGDWKNRIKKEDFNRPSDIYIFCLLNHKDKDTVDPLNMNQWLFFVLSTKRINEIYKNKSSISLNTLEKITNCVKYDELKNKIIEEYIRYKNNPNGT